MKLRSKTTVGYWCTIYMTYSGYCKAVKEDPAHYRTRLHPGAGEGAEGSERWIPSLTLAAGSYGVPRVAWSMGGRSTCNTPFSQDSSPSMS